METPVTPTKRRRKKKAPSPPAPEQSVDAEEIKPDRSKPLVKHLMYQKVVAMRNSKGRYANCLFTIVEGQTYSYPAELAQWLIKTKRAK